MVRAAVAWTGLLAGTLLVVGCSTPKVVTHMTSREGQAKFIYQQSSFFNSKQGLVQCKASADGELSECADRPIFYKD